MDVDDDAGADFVNVIEKRTFKAQYTFGVMLCNKVNGIHCCNDNGKTAAAAATVPHLRSDARLGEC